jgi:predicted enzyme related to lactoylglutathione lyase
MTTPRPITHFQILSTDPDRSAAFYRSVFGWTVGSANAMAYRELTTGSIGGGIWPTQGGGPSIVQLFVEVPNVSAAVADAALAGGRTIIPPSVLPDGDEMAIIVDPDGVPFGLVRRKPASV